jgi:hypothetical protein
MTKKNISFLERAVHSWTDDSAFRDPKFLSLIGYIEYDLWIKYMQ